MVKGGFGTFEDVSHHRFLTAKEDIVQAFLFLHDGSKSLVDILFYFQKFLELIQHYYQLPFRVLTFSNKARASSMKVEEDAICGLKLTSN